MLDLISKKASPVWLLIEGLILAGPVPAGACSLSEFMLTADDPTAGAEFGRSVAVDGNIVVIGAAEGSDGIGVGPGAVYVFRKTREEWQQEALLTASDGTGEARFGQSAAVQSSLIVVGARDANTPVAQKAGAIYLFQRDRDGWVETAKLSAGDGRKGDQFGFNSEASMKKQCADQVCL